MSGNLGSVTAAQYTCLSGGLCRRGRYVMSGLPHPKPFLVRRWDLAPDLTVIGMCVGFENQEWRAGPLVDHLMDWLPEFALHPDELENMGSSNAYTMLKRAAYRVYTTNKTERRGEIGEILLHIIARQEFGTFPAVCKLKYKSSPNDTVKGFDLVHITYDEENNDLILWLGEAKFYKDAESGLDEAKKSIDEHLDAGFLKAEKMMLIGKFRDDTPGIHLITHLFDLNTSVDELVSRIRIPILLTYDSEALCAHQALSDQYTSSLRDEIETVGSHFAKRFGGYPVEVVLALVPMRTKQLLIQMFDKKIHNLQE